MTTTDLKPGDIVQHPEKGNGIINRRFARDDVGVMYADLDRDGISSFTFDPDGWERVETVRPGHVQVRVDDLADELRRYAALGQGPACLESNVMLRVTRALDAQHAESTPPAYEKPTSATVTLFCPDCGEALPKRHCRVTSSLLGGKWVTLEPNAEVHICQPAQPDEPTEFGARVTVTLPDGTREKRLRVANGDDWPWRNSDGDRHFWAYLIERGTVTLGWGQE